MENKWEKDIIESFKFGVVETIILKLLSVEDMYGYQIQQEIYKRSGNVIFVKEGSLYGPLLKMENRGFVSVYKQMAGQKRFRNYYHLEPLGREYFELELRLYNEFSDAADLILKDGGTD